MVAVMVVSVCVSFSFQLPTMLFAKLSHVLYATIEASDN